MSERESFAERWVPLAEIARPHGVRGEVRLRLFNKESDVLLDQDEILVRTPKGPDGKAEEEHEVSVERARRADDAILMKLFSIDDRDRADELRGSHVCVRRSSFPALDEGEFYAVDVVGSEVRLEGARIGEVVELISYPTVETILVKADDKEGDWEIPLTEGYGVRVDAEARVVEVATLDEIERIKPKKPKPPKEVRPRRWEKNKAASPVSGGEGERKGEPAKASAEKS